jgi:uncharacterized protein (DUF697 family)
MSSYASEMELGEFGELEGEGEYGEYEGEFGELGAGGVLSEAEEIGLASELLEINNEAELEQFLGGLISKIGKAAGGFIKSPVGQALGGILKGVAKKALPMVGGALGSMVAPGVGTALGSQLGSAVGNMFELELESMPQEEAEFEVARRLVGLTAAAASNAAHAPAGANPRAVARDAVIEAARDYAPGLHEEMAHRSARTRPSGRTAGAVGRARVGSHGAGAQRAAQIRRQPAQQAGQRAAQQAGQRPAQQGMRPGAGRGPGLGYAGFPYADFPYAEPAPDDWDTDGDGFAPEDADDARPTAGRWVRRGRRIILLGI